MSVWDDLRNRITSNLSFAVKQPAQFARGVSLGVQQVSPKIPSRFNIPAQLNATRQIATPVLQNYMKWNEKFKPTTMPVISAAKTAGSEYWKNIQQTANIARNRPVTPWNVAKTMGAAAMTGFNLPFQFVTKDVENMVERTPLKFARVKTPVGTLSASGVAGFGAVMAMPMGSPERFAKIAKFTDVNKIATELRGLKIAEKEIPALSKKLVNIKNIDEVTNVIKGHLDQLKGIITDPAQVQEIRTSIAEGQNILRSGTFNGRKLSTEELIPVRKSVENSLAKIGESRFKKPTGYSIQDVTPEGYGPTQATKGVEKYKWFNQQDKIFVPAENAKSAPIEGLDTFVHKDPMGGGWKVTEAKSGGAMSEAFKTQKEAIANATSRLQAFKKAGNDINAHIEKVSRYNSPSGVEGGVATTAKKVETLLDEATALRQARQGTGAFKGGEVYEQDLGRIGTRQVLVQGKDAEGNILGWYLPDKKSADILGQKTGFLQPAKFTTSELQPSTTPTAKIKTAINWMFPEKPVSGKLTQAPEESINLIKEAVAKNDIPAAKSLYKDIGKEYQLPKFDQLQNEVGLEYEQTLIETYPRRFDADVKNVLRTDGLGYKEINRLQNKVEMAYRQQDTLGSATKGVEGKGLKLQQQVDAIISNPNLTGGQKQVQVAPLTKQLDKLKLPYHSPSYGGVEGVSKGGRLGRKLTQPADLATIKAKSLEQVVSEQLPTGGGQAGNPTVSSSSEIITDPVNKIIEALKGAKPLVGEQGKLYSAERAKRVARVVSVGKKLPGEAGFYAQLGQLKGQLPKVEFESIKKQFRQEDLNALYQKVEDYNLMQPFEKITAKTGLSKLLGAEGGSLPTSGELKLLGEIFPPEFVQAVLDNRSTTQKLFTNAVDALNIPRSLMTSFDYSAGLRQAIFAAPRHPIRFAQAFMGQFRQSFSEKIFQAGQQAIKENPNYLLARGRLALTDTGKFIGGREEAFASNLAEKIPLFGRVVKASERAYIGMLNKFRMDLFSDMVNNSKKLGVAIDEKFLDDAAGLINNMTGRGELPSKLKGAAPLLNGAFFSPRLMASRLNLLNPTYYVGLSPVVRKEALQSLFTFTATGMTVLGLAKLAGASVGADPRSADFGKVKYGNTRYDIWGGFQQYPRMAGQLLSGKLVSTTSGKITTLGEGYKPLNRFDILQRFFESKTAPVPSFVLSLLKGQNNVGEPFNLPTEVVNRMIPMVIADMYDLAKEKGSPLGGLLATPGIFGVGVQTYGKQIPTRGKTAGGKPNIQYNAVPGLGEDIVNTITGKQVSNIPKEQWEPIVAKHNKDMMVDEIRTIQKQIQTGVIKKEDGMKRIQELMNKISSAVVKPVNASTGTSGGINVPMSKIARTPTVKLKQKKGKKVKLAKWRTIKAKSISFKAKKVKKPKITAYKLKKSLTGKA